MNVGLTRARTSMLVVGCAAALKRDEHWGNLVAFAKKKKCLFKVTRPYHALFKEESLSTMKPSDEEAEKIAGEAATVHKGATVGLRKMDDGPKAKEKKLEDNDDMDDDEDGDDDDYYGGGDEEEEEDALANLGSFDDDD
ncbi:hypothetical protein CBR_g54450 [Chara braunii]|uniref:DNA2/NAM7 helicase-like C-terminal domain-containing protein n=1 Tax=Chara braunii TaxID=69332 RepID=A0A388MCF9_CHABU|nr:hypothetical protein CBR_g54450 [Chara braunii]|eukprot:GBG92149.1 hypothetical protein CBR_g54450 [Chara braunii]